MCVVRDMLARSVKNQHGKWETNSRARIANVWREAHEAGLYTLYPAPP
jgi:hypothetical protein